MNFLFNVCAACATHLPPLRGLRTIAEERKRFHLVDEFFAPTESKTFFNGARTDLLHNLVKGSILDEGELENGVAGPKGLSDDAIRLFTTLRVMRRQVRNVLDDYK